MERISVSSEIVSEILNKFNVLKEELEIYLSAVQKSIDTAELRGWNDKKYIEFKDLSDGVLRNLKEATREIDESIVPFLRQLLAYIEEYQ
jgi:hypothetical protein